MSFAPQNELESLSFVDMMNKQKPLGQKYAILPLKANVPKVINTDYGMPINFENNSFDAKKQVNIDIDLEELR